jgi:hypothetical protein
MRRLRALSMPAVHSKLTAPGMCPPLAASTFSPEYSSGPRASQIARSAAPRRLCRYSRVAVGPSCRVRLTGPPPGPAPRWTAGTFCQPGQQAAVEVVVFRVADHVEQPDKTPGPAAAFVVIDHVDRIGCGPVRRTVFPGRPCSAAGPGLAAGRVGCAWGRQTRAGDMPFGVAGGAGQVHQNQVRASRRPSRSLDSITSGKPEKSGM